MVAALAASAAAAHPEKTIVMGLAECGGRMTTEIVPDIKKATLREVTLQNVEPGSTVSPQEFTRLMPATSCGVQK